jgi:ATP-binding cassette subfamily C protein LapB
MAALRGELQELQGKQQHFSIVGNNIMTITVYAVGAIFVVHGQLDVGSLIGASILSSRALASFSRVTQSQEIFERAVQAFSRLDALSKLPSERQKGHVPRELKGSLELVDVAFSWPGQPMPLFESLSLHMPAGSVMAVIGGNAAGKSSMIRMLVGLLEPDRGHVKYDGLDLRQLVPEWWRQQLVYLPQEPQFFDGTLRENLTVMNPKVDDETVLSWCRKLDLSSFFETQPQGLESPIRNGGAHLPVGIRRRLALVRALLTDGRIVVLDEPFEGIDNKGAQALMALLNELVTAGRSIIIATRDEGIIKSANIVLDLSSKPVPRVIENKTPHLKD